MMDVLIIGGGAAGLSAARHFRKKGVSCKIIEASDRLGGRAWTDHGSFGMPVDMGCSWVSGADRNSLANIARASGFTLVDHTHAPESLWIGDRRATAQERARYDRACHAIDKALTKAGKRRTTKPASDVIPRNLPFLETAQTWLGPMDYGVDFKDLSPIDHWEQADDQPSCFVKEGFGTLVGSLTGGLDVALNTKVSCIDWGGKGVVVETDKGTLRARYVLITVSTGVLGAERIKFRPVLPGWKQQAIHDVPMGLLVKVPLLFDGPRPAFEEGEWVTSHVDGGTADTACNFIAWPCGHPYIFGNVGGKLGWELSRAGADTTIDFALQRLTGILGNDVRKKVVKGLATDWATNPLTLGAYSVQRPGTHGARKELRRTVAERLFFAGEATSVARAALANGAWDSGKKAAKKIVRQIAS